MALEFTNKGRISLENRLCGFQGKNPVNTPEWEHFKGLLKHIQMNPVAVTTDMIYRTFNPIVDAMSGLQLRSPMEQFELWCDQNGYDYQYDQHHASYILRVNFKKW